MPPAHQHQAGEKPRPELADIFRADGEAYRQAHPLPLSHLKVMRAIEICRTAALGGHLQECESCAYQLPVYNSCRNRHCPQCGSLAKARWLEQRQAELLPVGYFHLVFTLPHELNPLVLTNKKILYDILFGAVSQTLLEFGRTHFGGTLGFTCVLHTWDQTLRDHFHLHCLIPAGALSFDLSRWVAARKDFLFSVQALSLVFRGKFLSMVGDAFQAEKLQFLGSVASLADPSAFRRLMSQLRAKKWVVYAKKPFSAPDRVLDYLGRYTHRVAISNNRIVRVESGRVTFTYRDRKHGNQLKPMTLDTNEFIRRFLLHVLPPGFMRIRHFGFLANRCKKRYLARCRELLGLQPQIPPAAKKSTRELMLELAGVDPALCPVCRVGTMIVTAQLPALPVAPSRAERSPPPLLESS